MRGQFFIIATVIMIYTLMTMTSYIYDFSNINLIQLKEMPQLFYIKQVQSILNQTVTSSGQSLDCNRLETDLDATEDFLENEMISRGVTLTIVHHINCNFLNASFDIGLSAPEFYVAYGQPIQNVQQPSPFDGVLWYTFDDGIGLNVSDSSTYLDNGAFSGETLSDGTSYSGSSPTDLHTPNGYFGDAVSFDGIDEYLNLTNSSNLNTTSLTVMFWFNLASDPDCDGNNNWRSLIRKGTTGGTDTGWDVTLEQDRSLYFDIGNGTAGQNRINSGKNITVGDWTHLAFTYDSSTGNQIIYMDGLPKASQIVKGPMKTNTQPVLISGGTTTGSCPNGNGYVNGTVDEVRIWNSSLSAQEINNEMQSSLPTSRPVASYSFEEGSGNYVNDTHIWIDGFYGPALSFDGLNDYVYNDGPYSDNNNYHLDNMPQITVMAWFKLNQLPSVKGEPEDIVVKKNSVSPWNSYYFVIDNSNNNLYFGLRNSSQVAVTPDAGAVQTDAWYNVAGVYDGSNVMIYLNGTLMDTKPIQGNIFDSDNPLRIGADWYGGGRFNGTIDDVKIWSRALSATEIRTEMYGKAFQACLDGTPYGQCSANQPQYCSSGTLINSCDAPYTCGCPSGQTCQGDGTCITPSENVLWLKFNEANGTKTYDSSQYGNNGNFYGETFNDGTLGNGSSWTNPTRLSGSNCMYGNCLGFDGGGDVVNVSDFIPNTSLTITAWIYPKLISGDERTIVSKWGTPGKTSEWLFRLSSTNLQFWVQNITNGYEGPVASSGANIQTNGWYHVAVVYNRTSKNASFYVNGTYKGSGTFPYNGQTQNGTDIVRIGAQGGGTFDPFNGTIDEVRIWNRTLSKTEIQNEMKGSLPTTEPVASYSFEEPSGATYINDTHVWVNGTHGSTLSGSALSFDGVNDHVNVSDSPSLHLTGDFTINAWIWLNSIQSSAYPSIVSKTNGNPDQADEWAFYIDNSSSKIAFKANGISQYGNAVSRNSWQMVTAQRVGNDLQFYINAAPGSPYANFFSGLSFASMYDLVIGWRGDSPPFNGTIDDVKIWNRSLSQTEIQNCFQYGC